MPEYLALEPSPSSLLLSNIQILGAVSKQAILTNRTKVRGLGRLWTEYSAQGGTTESRGETPEEEEE
jgi:hypothetical protein